MEPEQKAKMDAAAAEAEKDFYEMFTNAFGGIKKGLAEDVQNLVTDWGKRHYMKCGYKRLGLIVSQRESFNSEV